MRPVPTILMAKKSVDPDIFGRYCLLERLGQGGMAEIFRARTFDSENLDAYLVIKRILPNLAEDDEFISMFVDEARITVQLNHPNICQLYELGKLDGSYFIVMEHIAGQDLLAFQNHFRSNRSSMQPAQAAHIVAKIARALDYAHRKEADDGTPLEIVHRDISPQNILVSYNGEVKVIDFGIARARNRRQQTQVGVLKGKFGYMSPEQVTDSKIDGQSDVFAAGIMLWELLTNRRLFYAKNSTEILKLVQSEPVRPPSELVSSVPAELDAITLKALYRDRRYRYRTGQELADDLERWLANQPVEYGERELAQWTCHAFSKDLELEHDKRRLFRRFVSEEDVLEYQREHGVPNATAEGAEHRQLSADEFNRYKESVSQRQSIEDILAEQGSDSIRRAIRDSASRSLPMSGELTPITTDDIPPAGRQPTSVGLSRSAFVLMFALAAVVGVVFGVWALGEDEGFVSLSVEPAVAHVTFDGRPLAIDAGSTRISAESGRYPLTVSMPGYEGHQQVVEVSDDETTSLRVKLDRLPPREVTLRVPEDWEEQPRVFFDGIEALIQERELVYRVAPIEPILVEIDRPGYFVARTTVTPVQIEELELDSLMYEPIRSTVELRTDPVATVSVNGVRHEQTTEGGLLFEGLEPHQAHTLKLQSAVPGYQELTYTLIFEGAFDRSLTLSLPRIGRQAPDDDLGGQLIIEGDPSQWYAVSVDGRDIGLTSPFDDTSVALASGSRMLTFRRGNDSWDHEITVEEGATVRVGLPVEGMPTHQQPGRQQ